MVVARREPPSVFGMESRRVHHEPRRAAAELIAEAFGGEEQP
jgi:hypothetical protein